MKEGPGRCVQKPVIDVERVSRGTSEHRSTWREDTASVRPESVLANPIQRVPSGGLVSELITRQSTDVSILGP